MITFTYDNSDLSFAHDEVVKAVVNTRGWRFHHLRQRKTGACWRDIIVHGDMGESPNLPSGVSAVPKYTSLKMLRRNYPEVVIRFMSPGFATPNGLIHEIEALLGSHAGCFYYGMVKEWDNDDQYGHRLEAKCQGNASALALIRKLQASPLDPCIDYYSSDEVDAEIGDGRLNDDCWWNVDFSCRTMKKRERVIRMVVENGGDFNSVDGEVWASLPSRQIAEKLIQSVPAGVVAEITIPKGKPNFQLPSLI